MTLRSKRLPALIFLGLLVLSACAKRGDLASDEVLRRSALASNQLASAKYQATATLSMGTDNARNTFNFVVEGLLQEGGKSHQMTVGVDGDLMEGGETYNLKATLNVLVSSPGDVFLKVDELTVEPAHPSMSFDSLEAIRGRWVRMPSGGAAQSGVTPDPSLLRAQSQVITVTRDKGLKDIHGTEAYTYDVALNKEKLLAFLQSSALESGEAFDVASAEAFTSLFSATGELWIDAAEFFVHKLSWEMESRSDDGLTASIDVEFTDHNKAPAIVLPPEAEVLMSSGSSLLTPFLPSGEAASSEELIDLSSSSASVSSEENSSSLSL